jgi:hypothetical protein
MIENLGFDSGYIMLGRWSLEDCLGYVERAGYGLVWDRAEW